MKKRSRLIIGVIALLLLACACPATSLPTSSAQPTNPPFIYSTSAASNVLLSDDFSVTSPEMEAFSDENGSTETRNGVYVVRAISDLWHWGRSNSQFGDTVAEVDATMAVGPS